MPRRTIRPTNRSSKPSNVPKRQYSQNSSPPSSQHQANIPQNSVMGNISQGMTLGAGAAIGSSMVHGALDSMSSPKETPKEQTYENYQQLQEDEIRCGHLMRQFKDCCTSYNDLNNCKPLLEYYVSCMSNNTKF